MSEKYLMIDLDDERTASIADVISNKTCKKILSALSDKEMSVGDLAERLGAPLNTVDYNVKKLVEAGLVEKTKDYFWSKKGKKIPVYTLSHKKIVISPRSMLKGILPAFIFTGIAAFGIKLFYVPKQYASSGVEMASAMMKDMSERDLYTILANAPPAWAWFFVGALVALLIVLLWNWRKL